LFLYVIRHRQAAALIAALLWVCLCLCLGLLWLGREATTELKADAHRHLDEIDRFFMQTDTSLAELATVKSPACSPEMLREFHRVMLDNEYLRDIIYFAEDSLVPLCSATLGMMDHARPLPQPQDDLLHPGRQFWMHLPSALLNGKETYYTVKSGRIGISEETSSIEAPTTRNMWESFLLGWTTDTPYRPIAGTPGLHRKYMDQQGSLLHPRLMYSACATALPSCLTLATPWPTALARHAGFIFAALLLALITAAMLYQAVRRWLCHKASPIGRLRSGLKRRRGFTCVYQPLVDISSGAPIGCEVLARFEDRIGTLPPDEFVPIIMQTGRTWEFTELVLETALRELKPVTDLHRAFKVSVNFYPQDLHVDRLPAVEASRHIAQAARDGIHLNLEVLETGLADATDLTPMLDFVRGQGFTVSIDDFGTGSSNLHQLRCIQADFIKIDRSFVSELSADSSSIRSSLVHHIVEIANQMRVQIIAEGVETFTQLQVLSSLGIRYGQGYFFSPPVPVERLLDYMRTEQALDGVRSLPHRSRQRAIPIKPAIA
jgi:sensor c-di-GMP phosphodiesterase-like protein